MIEYHDAMVRVRYAETDQMAWSITRLPDLVRGGPRRLIRALGLRVQTHGN